MREYIKIYTNCGDSEFNTEIEFDVDENTQFCFDPEEPFQFEVNKIHFTITDEIVEIKLYKKDKTIMEVFNAFEYARAKEV